ncbi:MAG: DUF2059 domain-containing protein [Dyella sp.]
MRKWWVMALAMVWLGNAWADPPSEQQVRQLMTTIGLGKTLLQMNGQVAGMMQKQLPCVPADTWQNFIDANASDQLIGRLVPVFQKHFSAEDIDGLIRFYSSPLGQKVLTEMPQAMAEATQANAQWSHERMSQLVDQLQKDGKLNARGQCPASGTAAADHDGLGDDDDDGDDDAPAMVAPVVNKSAHHPVSKTDKNATSHKPVSKKSTHKGTSSSHKPAAATSTTHKPATTHKTPSKTPAKASVKKATDKPASAAAAGQG